MLCSRFFLNDQFVVDPVVVPSAPKYGHWMGNKEETNSLPGYDEIYPSISRSSLPNYEEAMVMSDVSTSLHI